jgi:Holliday junction resolvase
MDILKKEGWVCFRSAASHSPIDVIAGKDGEVLLIQVKSAKSRMSQAELNEFCSWARMFGARGEIWRRWRSKPGFEKYVAYGSATEKPATHC